MESKVYTFPFVIREIGGKFIFQRLFINHVIGGRVPATKSRLHDTNFVNIYGNADLI